jgi:predicted acetyltransferase
VTEATDEPDVNLHRVKLPHKPVLANLIQFYRYDFSGIRSLDLTAHGTFSYLWLDNYFTEAGRYPFFIWDGEKLAGFALMRRIDGVNHLSEFFVMKAHRRRGVGRLAAIRLFRMYPGDWSLEMDHNNDRARKFWSQVLESVCEGPVKRTEQYPPRVDHASTMLEFHIPPTR